MSENKNDYQVSVKAVISKNKYAYQIYVRAVWNGTVYQTEVVKEYRNTLTVLGGLGVDGTVVRNDGQDPVYFEPKQLQKALAHIMVTYRDKSVVSLVRTLEFGVDGDVELPPNTFFVNGRRYDCNCSLPLEVILLSDSYLIGYHTI